MSEERMSKYRKKPVVIEAIQWNGKNMYDVIEFSGASDDFVFPLNEDYCVIETLEGNHKCSLDDFIIKGVQGEFYPCKPDIFEQTYEKVEEPHQ
jgi:hypothetical protein